MLNRLEKIINFNNSQQKIITNDCLLELRGMSNNSVDIIVTSPPYNIGIKYNNYKDTLGQVEYIDWLKEVFVELRRVLKDDGSFFLNIGSTSVDPDIGFRVRGAVGEVFKLQNDIIWCKSISLPVEGNIRSFGHFKPINSERFLNHQWENIFHLTKSSKVKIDRLAIGVPYEDKSNIERWNHDGKGLGQKKNDLRCGGNVWFIPYKTVVSQKQHPAGYPVELPERCIKLHGLKDNLVVLDPFMGAGTTLVACKKLKVNGVGIDLDESYSIIAKERLENV